MTKKCACCKKDKDVNEFGKVPNNKDGLNYYCNECNNKKTKATQKKKKDSDNEFYKNFL